MHCRVFCGIPGLSLLKARAPYPATIARTKTSPDRYLLGDRIAPVENHWFRDRVRGGTGIQIFSTPEPIVVGCFYLFVQISYFSVQCLSEQVSLEHRPFMFNCICLKQCRKKGSLPTNGSPWRKIHMRWCCRHYFSFLLFVEHLRTHVMSNNSLHFINSLIHSAMLGIVPGTGAHSAQVRKVSTRARSNGGWRTDRRHVSTS